MARPNYPVHACAKGLSNRFCPSVSQSVCQSVCPVKIFEINSFTGLRTWDNYTISSLRTRVTQS